MQLVTTNAGFTRPADTTAYAANDLIANSTTAGSVVPMTFVIPYAGALELYRVGVSCSNAVATNAKFNVNLYTSIPTCANGDNGALSTTSSGWIGSVAVDASGMTFTDSNTNWSAAFTQPLILFGTNRTIYGLLQATAAYTPTSAETFTVTLMGKAYL